MENKSNIIIIGAGACGLAAARELTRAGRQVVVLEARNRLGGRIYTYQGSGFSKPVEAGAEFIHGELPLTQALVQEAGIACYDLAGKNYQVKNGQLLESEEFLEDFPVLLQKLAELTHDMPLATFLENYLTAGEYEQLRQAVIRFAEGYDAADINKVSTFALREEWESGGASGSGHPVGGYGQVINFLADQTETAGGKIYLNTVVQEIRWEQGQVTVFTAAQIFRACQVLITVPLGVLQAEPGSPGAIHFSPALPQIQAAVALLGFGAVIKVCLEFKEAFWEKESAHAAQRAKAPEMAFLFSDSSLFTAWWSQLPELVPMLTAWLGGPTATRLKDKSEAELVEKALLDLVKIFGTTLSFLKKQVRASRVFNWAADPFARGAYAYATVEASAAGKILNEPVQHTLFFAGEALYAGPAMGTVEAALASGTEAARKILANPEITKN